MIAAVGVRFLADGQIDLFVEAAPSATAYLVDIAVLGLNSLIVQTALSPVKHTTSGATAQLDQRILSPGRVIFDWCSHRCTAALTACAALRRLCASQPSALLYKQHRSACAIKISTGNKQQIVVTPSGPGLMTSTTRWTPRSKDLQADEGVQNIEDHTSAAVTRGRHLASDVTLWMNCLATDCSGMFMYTTSAYDVLLRPAACTRNACARNA